MKKMVSVAEGVSEQVLTFEIYGKQILDGNIFTEILSQEEQGEMINIVSELQVVDSIELMTFTL